MDEMRKSCPLCGASLPEEASFCPCCAQNIRPRRRVKVPSHLRRKALKLVLGVLAAAAVAARGVSALGTRHLRRLGRGDLHR